MSNSVVFENDGIKYRFMLEQDTDPSDPRDDDNVGTMVCWHRRYKLGDDQPTRSPDGWRINLARSLEVFDEEADDMEGGVTLRADAILDEQVIMLPLYLCDHSGITMSTGSFNDRWDSGQVGWIYTTKAKALEEYGDGLENVEKHLKGEVEVYNQYLTGDTYGFVLEKLVKCECCGHVAEKHEESVWGFYGYDITTNGVLDNIDSKLHEPLLAAWKAGGF